MNRQLLHTPEGVRDIYGNEYVRKLAIQRKLHERIAGYGYADIQTPTFEFFDVFSKEIGTTPSKELFKFFDKENNTLVLRPDFTPSIARCAAKYFCDYEDAIRLTYCGNTFTNTSSYQGKLAEVTQMGAELIGDGSVEADGEMIALVIESLQSIGLADFQVSVGEVDFFKGLCREAGLDDDTELSLRDCISGKNYFAAQELLEERGVAEPCRENLLNLTEQFGTSEILSSARRMVTNPQSVHAIERLEKLYEVLKLYGVEQYVSFDLGMLSKYRYYTGVIFKVFTYGIGDAVVKGGRYDNLLSRFGKDAPAIGFCLTVDDLMEALDYQKKPTPAHEIETVTYKSNDSSDFAKALEAARKMRRDGKSVALMGVKA